MIIASNKLKKAQILIPALLTISNVVLVILIFLIRWSFSLFQYEAMPNLTFLILLSFAFIFPISFLIGYTFTAFTTRTEYKAVSYVYFIESLGAFLGGILFTFLIAGRLDAILVSSILVIISLMFMALHGKKSFLPNPAFLH